MLLFLLPMSSSLSFKAHIYSIFFIFRDRVDFVFTYNFWGFVSFFCSDFCCSLFDISIFFSNIFNYIISFEAALIFATIEVSFLLLLLGLYLLQHLWFLHSLLFIHILHHYFLWEGGVDFATFSVFVSSSAPISSSAASMSSSSTFFGSLPLTFAANFKT